ncbi:hypothetical protein EOD39_11951 [Acipenser ruthenus]|uniref:Uncharacterized protein n=1 Tax=Acipenser ruthenus TaxID=7906 RepID=A0A444TWB7_ACIRT|nr:hypothetical protein EOD39_11951 [Acipenser ruthenus]
MKTPRVAAVLGSCGSQPPDCQAPGGLKEGIQDSRVSPVAMPTPAGVSLEKDPIEPHPRKEIPLAWAMPPSVQPGGKMEVDVDSATEEACKFPQVPSGEAYGSRPYKMGQYNLWDSYESFIKDFVRSSKLQVHLNRRFMEHSAVFSEGMPFEGSTTYRNSYKSYDGVLQAVTPAKSPAISSLPLQASHRTVPSQHHITAKRPNSSLPLQSSHRRPWISEYNDIYGAHFRSFSGHHRHTPAQSDPSKSSVLYIPHPPPARSYSQIKQQYQTEYRQAYTAPRPSRVGCASGEAPVPYRALTGRMCQWRSTRTRTVPSPHGSDSQWRSTHTVPLSPHGSDSQWRSTRTRTVSSPHGSDSQWRSTHTVPYRALTGLIASGEAPVPVPSPHRSDVPVEKHPYRTEPSRVGCASGEAPVPVPYRALTGRMCQSRSTRTLTVPSRVGCASGEPPVPYQALTDVPVEKGYKVYPGGSDQIEKVYPCGSDQIEKVYPGGSDQIEKVYPCGSDQIEKVYPGGSDQIEKVYPGGSDQIEKVYPCGSDQIEKVYPGGSDQIEKVYPGGSDQIEKVYPGGSDQIEKIYPCGSDQIEKIYPCGSDQIEKIYPCGSDQIEKVYPGGSDQIEKIYPCGSDQIEKVYPGGSDQIEKVYPESMMAHEE